LRLEIGSNIDKKKSELYFFIRLKKILTEKNKSTLPQVTPENALPAQLTDPDPAATFLVS
jgi:hypothetical protein